MQIGTATRLKILAFVGSNPIRDTIVMFVIMNKMYFIVHNNGHITES